MAKDKLTEYSATNASNDVIGDISVAEGMLPSAVNNALREQMTHLKNFSDGTDAIDALAVDNLKLDGNTISSTNLNGNVTIDPNGTGNTIVASGKVGINISSPDNTLHVHTGSAGAVTANVDFDDLVVESNGNMGMSFLSPNDTFQQIGFGDADDNDIGKIAYQHTNDSMQFTVNGAERLRITSGGAVGIGTSSPSRTLDVHSGSAATPINIRTTQALSLITFDNSSDTSGNHLVGFQGDDFVVGDTNITMRLDSSGRLGLGTSPQRNLHVHQPTASSSFIQLTNTVTGSSTGDEGFRMGTDASGFAYVWQGENQHLAFATSNAEKMRIDSSGNVGIGTSSPTSNRILDANGQVRFQSSSSGRYFDFINDSAASYLDVSHSLNIRTNGASSLATAMTLDTSGNVLVGTTTANPADANDASGAQISQAGTIQASSSGSTPAIFNRGSDGAAVAFLRSGSLVGSISITTTSTAYNTSSDYRLKENVTYDWDATTRLKQLKPARFNFIADADTTVDGFLAHEAQTVVPEAVTGTHNEVDGDGNPVMQGIDQSKLVPLLVKTIQELEARITALEAN